MVPFGDTKIHYVAFMKNFEWDFKILTIDLGHPL
jgi:hypothetical protein